MIQPFQPERERGEMGTKNISDGGRDRRDNRSSFREKGRRFLCRSVGRLREEDRHGGGLKKNLFGGASFRESRKVRNDFH